MLKLAENSRPPERHLGSHTPTWDQPAIERKNRSYVGEYERCNICSMKILSRANNCVTRHNGYNYHTEDIVCESKVGVLQNRKRHGYWVLCNVPDSTGVGLVYEIMFTELVPLSWKTWEIICGWTK